MTYKEKKTFLEGYQHCIRDIQGLNDELEKWETIATHITQTLSDMPHGSRSETSKLEKNAIESAELMEKISIEIKTAEKIRENIKNAIENSAKNKRHENVLKTRYIYGLSVGKMAYRMHKDPKTVSNIINAAIRGLDI